MLCVADDRMLMLFWIPILIREFKIMLRFKGLITLL